MTTTSDPSTLESDLLSHLTATPALEDLHSTLLVSLQRTGWTEKIRKLSLELLRAGRCDRFDDVLSAIVASAEGRKHPALEEDLDDGVENVDVRIPRAVVEQGVRAIKEVLREVVVLEDEGDGHEGEGKNGSGNGNGASPVKKEKKGKNSK